MPLKQQWKVRGFDRVEGMAGLVQQRTHVSVDADRVHEDQGQLPKRQGHAVTAGSLALALVHLEAAGVVHGLLVAAKVRLDLGENRSSGIDQAANLCTRL